MTLGHQIVDKAIEIVKNGWTQGSWYVDNGYGSPNYDGSKVFGQPIDEDSAYHMYLDPKYKKRVSCCATGAVGLAAAIVTHKNAFKMQDQIHVLRACVGYLVDTYGEHDGLNIMSFNDRDDATVNDVIEMFEGARERLPHGV